MTDILMRSPVAVRVTRGPDKHVRFPIGDVEAAMGMHGELAEFFGAQPGSFTPLPSTLDYVAGALTACLASTLRRTLAARGIDLDPSALDVQGEAVLVVEDSIPMLRAVEVHYTLSGVADADREKAERAHAVHDRACSVSRSLEAAVEIRTRLTLA